MAKNPLDLVQSLRDRMRALVMEQTQLRRELGFRDAFEALVRAADFLPRVLFEARPPFVIRDRSELDAEAARVHPAVLNAVTTAAKGDAWQVFQEPYSHQVEAFRASAGRGRSIVLATGTASGKTESMALP